MSRKFVWTFMLCFLGMTQGFAAKGADVATTVYNLGEVVVSAPDKSGVESIGTLHEITDKEMELRNVKTLDQALELLPGLDIRKGAQGIPRVNIRGLRSRHVVLLLNGIPFNSTYDAQFDPSTIPVENIAKIKVSYGTHSVLYGQGGLGGAINIITKKGSQGFHGKVAGDLDERGNPNALATLSNRNETLDFFVSGSKQTSDGYQVSEDFTPTSGEDGGIRENSDYDRENLFANVGFQAGDDFEFGVSLGANQGEFGKPPSAINDKADLFSKSPKYERTEDYTGQFGQVSMGYDPGGLLGVRAWAFVNKNEEQTARYDGPDYNAMTLKGGYAMKDETVIQGVALQGSLDYETLGRAVFSLNAEKDEYDSAGGEVLAKKGPLVPFDTSDEIELYALALEYDITLFQDLGLVAGYSHHWQNLETGSDDDQGSYLLGAFYDLTQTTRVRASYARKIRFASIQNLFDRISGNNSLTTEESDNYEAGITQKLPWDMEGDLVFFLNDVENYISKDPVTDIYENHDEYRFRGVEATLSRAFLETGMVRLGYAYLEATDKSPGTRVDDLEYRPTHKLTLESSYAFDFGLTAYASFVRLMDQYIYASDYTKEKLKDFSLVEVKLEQSLIKDQWFVYGGVENLLDENYQESYGFPQAGRTAYVGMKFLF